MAAPTVPANIAAALRYGPQTQTTLRRSQYLTDALRQMNETGGQNIRSGAELGAKLLATAILQRSATKAERGAVDALKADQNSETAALISALRPPAPTPAPATAQAPATPPPMPAPQPVRQAPVASLPSAQPQQQAQAPNGIDPIWKAAIQQESGGRPGVLGPQTQYGQAQGLTQMLPSTAEAMAEKLGLPWKPQLMTAATPEAAAYQEKLGRAYFDEGLQKYGGDPQKALAYYHGGPNEALWGPKTRAHVDAVMSRVQPQQQISGVAGQSAMLGGEGAPPDQMAQAAQSFPPAGPSGGGAAPAAASPPQAPAAGANAWPTWQPTPQQISYVESLLQNPRTHEQGVAEARKLQAKMAEPAEAEIVSMNGVSFYVSKTPGQGGQPVMIPVPDGARTEQLSAQEAGLAYAPQGLNVQRDPFGNLKEAPGAPPANFNSGPGGYTPIKGSDADPYRTQAPATGYAYVGQGVQAPISGSAADPRNANNYVETTGKIRSEIKPVIDQAIQLKRNIDAVRTGYQQQNGPGDIAMINGLQKLIDEGVVREGDVALQLKGQGVDGGVAGLKGYLTSDGFFADPKIRSSILNTANSLYGSLNSTYKDRVLGYRGMTTRLLGDGAFEDVFPSSTAQSLGWANPPQANPQPPAPNPAVVAGTPGSRASAIAEARKRGLPIPPGMQ